MGGMQTREQMLTGLVRHAGIDEKAFEAARAAQDSAYPLDGLPAAIRAYLSALPSSPVSELVDHLKNVATILEPRGLPAAVATCTEAATTLTTLSTRNAELEREVKRLREALEFYADTSKYPAPFTGGLGELYYDCGQIARSALSPHPREASMSEIKLLPCPFCGTHPEDPDHPYVSIETYDALQTECGKCGACWPKIKRSDFDDDMTDADLVGLFNRRAALSFATVAEVFVDGKRLYNITYPADALDKLPKGTPLYLDPPPLSELEVENARLQARVAELDKALAPFAEIAGEAWADGSGWTNAACQNDRICDWFGPSAFLAARRVREGGKVDG